MTTWLDTLNNSLVTGWGYTLIHTLWQSALVALSLWVFRGLFRGAKAELKYWMAITALVGAVIWSGTTFYHEMAKIQSVSLVGATASVSLESVAAVTPAPSTELTWIQLTQQKQQVLFQELQPYLPLLVAIWLLGVGFFLLRMEGGLFYIRRLKKSGVVAAPMWQERLFALVHRMGLKQTVQLLESQLITVPMVIGHLKPVVLLPVGIFAGLSIQQVEAVLAHELAHIKRCDYVINLGQNVIEALLFFNPFVWWISAVIREEREVCCDDQAVKVCGDQFTYARALTDLQGFAMAKPVLGMALFNKRSHLFNRIKRLIQPASNTVSIKDKLISASLLLTLLLLGAWQFQKVSSPLTSPTLLNAEAGFWPSLTDFYHHADTLPPLPETPEEAEVVEDVEVDEDVEVTEELEELLELGQEIDVDMDVKVDVPLELSDPPVAPSFDFQVPAVWVAPKHNGPRVLPDDFLEGVDFDDVVIKPFGSFPLDTLPDILNLVDEYQRVLDQELSGKLSAEEMGRVRERVEEVTKNLEVELRNLDLHLQDRVHFDAFEEEVKAETFHKMEEELQERQMKLQAEMAELKHRDRGEERRQLEMAHEQLEMARNQVKDEAREHREMARRLQREAGEHQREMVRQDYERARELRVRDQRRHENSTAAKKKLIAELLADGLIKSADDRVKLDYQNQVLKVNGTKVTGNQREKYLDILQHYYKLKDSDKLKFEFSPGRSSMSHESD